MLFILILYKVIIVFRASLIDEDEAQGKLTVSGSILISLILMYFIIHSINQNIYISLNINLFRNYMKHKEKKLSNLTNQFY